ncbi:hypothetical protein GJ496_000381 [Pomphorhynchus laevis]|nr:hypothetical protein GJ496_000381 [Pomphorhynchus laevis]
MKSFFMYSQAIITIKRYKWWPIIGSALLIPPSIYYIFRAPQSNDLSLFERTSTIANSSSYFGPAVLNPVNIRFPLQNYADYLIVGGGASAASAVKVIKAHHPKSKVVLVTEEDEMPYNRSAVRRELWTCSEEQRQKMSITRWDGKDSSLYLLDEDAFTTDSPSDQAITILKGRKVIKFDLKHNYAMLDNQWKIHYDKALISTGTGISSPEWLRQSVSIDAKNKVFKLQSVDDVNKAIEAVKSVKSVAVIGCGPESVELAYTISSSFNVKVTLVCTSEKGILGNMLPKWFSEKCKNSLRSSKIKVYDRVRIDKITSKDDTILIKMFKGLFRYQLILYCYAIVIK